MLNDILSKDHIAKYLINKSSFTETQLDTLLISIQKEKFTLKDQTMLRDIKKVSIGSFNRSLEQSKNNLEKALYTVILSEYLSIFSEDNLSKLIKIGELLKEFNNIELNKGKTLEILDQISYNISVICHNI